MKNIPVVLLTYNRPDLLKNALIEHERVNTPTPICVVDDGSIEENQLGLLDNLEKDSRYKVLKWPHRGYKNQFLEIMKYFGDQDVNYYVFVEDDAVFSINWFAWGCLKLRELESIGGDIGVLALYTGHPNLRQEICSHVYKHNTEHFYGTCCLFVNPRIVDEYIHQAYDLGWNPDVAIREMSLKKSRFHLFVASPTLVQHIGEVSLLGAPPHRSGLFLGRDKDALVEL